MGIEKGDFILIDYTGKVKETDDVFTTTIEAVAQKEGLYKTGEVYEPELVIVGEGWVLKALDDSLLNFKAGKTGYVEIPPEKAFGHRDPEKIKRVPLRRLTARGITPRLGMRVEIDGKSAIVRTIGSGRIQLDYNLPLAGKTLSYELTIQKKLTNKSEKLAALIHRRISTIDIKKFNLRKGKTNVNVVMPEEAFYIEGIQLSKRGIAMDIQKFFPEIATVEFVESFKKPESGGEQPPQEKNL